MKQAQVQILRPAGEKTEYRIAAWTAFLTLLLAWGGLRAMRRMWGAALPPQAGMIAAAAVGVGICAAAQLLHRRYKHAWWITAIPWPILLAVVGVGRCRMGFRLWVNIMLERWNQVHDSGLVLLSAEGGPQETLAFSLVTALFIGELAWMLVSHRRLVMSSGFCLFWVLLPLLTNGFDPLAAALLLSSLIGLRMSIGAPRLTVRSLAWTVGTVLVFYLCAALLPRADLESVNAMRRSAVQTIHDVRYGETLLPEGDLYRAWRLQRGNEDMMTVHSEQQKSLYLRGYVGGDYADGKWSELPESAYGGDNTGMLDWLAEQGFDPLTQTAAYYQLTGGEQAPEENRLTVNVSGACREYAYIPATLESVARGRLKEENDSALVSRGLLGARSYAVDELSGSRPAELLIADSWVSDPQTEEQRAYSEAESVYRAFVYDHYTEVDSGLDLLLYQKFWQDYETDGDGIYSALTRVREVLSAEERYAASPEPAPAGEDPIRWFLTESHEGNAVLYAGTAVQALRAHGIPARYAEGYYVPSYTLASSEDGSVSVTPQNAHAWVEVYFDGVGWLPVDVTPGYYFDAITLQQMVSLPDTVRKTAAVEEKPSQAEDGGGDGFDAAPLEPSLTSAVNIALVLLGILALLLVIAAMLLAFAEIARGICLHCLRRRYEASSNEGRVQIINSCLFGLISLWGIKGSLGWNTEELDHALAWQLNTVERGEYKKICALLEKAVYGGIELEPYEERMLLSFLQQLADAVRQSGDRRKQIGMRYLWLTMF